jgi:EmrB/QacA subfamily drug resistance transporter
MPAEQLTRGRLVLVTVGIGLAMFLAALDQTIVGTAMPRIVADLRGLDLYAWVLTAYLVTSTTMTPIAGKLGDLFGRKPLLLVGMAGFVLSSALCGLAGDMIQLIAYRGLQGIFGGILFSTVFASIADLYAPEKRARIQGMFGGIFGLASVIGPVVGGYLTDTLSWRWIFYVNLPVGVLAVAFVLLTMPAVRARVTGWADIDILGAVVLAAGLIPLLIGFSITRDHAWTSPEVLGLLAFSVVALLVFGFIEARAREPIVPLALFRNRTFAVACLAGFLVTVGFFGVIVYVPLLYQGVLGVAATNSGLLLTPMMAGLITGSIISGQLMVRIPRYRYIGTVGISLILYGLWLLAQVRVGTAEIEVVRDLIIVGFGVGTTFPLYLNSVQSAVSPEFTGVVTSQVQFWRNVGGTIGTAILGSVLSQRLPQNVSTEVAALGLPEQVRAALPQGASAQALFDPAAIATARASLPPQAVAAFEQVLQAVRVALAATLHDLFLLGAVTVALAIVVSVFLDDVPIRRRAAPVREPAPAFGD